MYIDPSAGGLLVQVLLIAFGVISGAVLVFSGKIKMAFARFMRTLREKKARYNIPEDQIN
jgi:hypothetical protein